LGRTGPLPVLSVSIQDAGSHTIGRRLDLAITEEKEVVGEHLAETSHEQKLMLPTKVSGSQVESEPLAKNKGRHQSLFCTENLQKRHRQTTKKSQQRLVWGQEYLPGRLLPMRANGLQGI